MGGGTSAAEVLSSQLLNGRKRIGIRQSRRLSRDSDLIRKSKVGSVESIRCYMSQV